MKRNSSWYRYAAQGTILLFLYFFLSGLYDAYSPTGLASWYSEKESGYKTANGEIYDDQAMTAAHRRLPFGTKVRVISLITGRAVQVRINDRGPFIPGRIIDLTKRAATELGLKKRGVGRVRIEIIN